VLSCPSSPCPSTQEAMERTGTSCFKGSHTGSSLSVFPARSTVQLSIWSTKMGNSEETLISPSPSLLVSNQSQVLSIPSQKVFGLKSVSLRLHDHCQYHVS
jgi:hypothetical protein